MVKLKDLQDLKKEKDLNMQTFYQKARLPPSSRSRKTELTVTESESVKEHLLHLSNVLKEIANR